MARSSRTTPYLRASLLALAVLVAGCASAGGGSNSSSAITAEDLAPGRFANAVEAIERLRPTWFTRLEAVFVEGHETDLDRLRMEPVAGIAEIRRLTCEQATMRYPVNCITGYFLEVTRTR